MVLTWARSTRAVAALAALVSLAVALLASGRTLLPDEIRPLIFAGRSLAEQLQAMRADIVQTPVYNLLVREWLALFGETDQAAKAFAAVVSAAGMAAFVGLASRVTRSAVLAGAIAVLFDIRLGGSLMLVRMYGLTILLVILALLAWDRWIRTDSRQAAALWVGLMALAVNTHASAGLLMPAFIIAAWPTPRRFATMVLAVIPILALLPWVIYVLPVIHDQGLAKNVQQLPANLWFAVRRIPFDLLSGEDPGSASPKRILVTLAAHYPLAALAGALFAAVGIAWLADRRRVPNARAELPSEWPRFVAGAIVVPPLLLLGISLGWRPVVSTRYLLVSLPAYWLALTWMLTEGAHRVTRILALAVLAWVAIGVGLSWDAARSPALPREMAEYAKANWQPGDLLLLGNHHPYGYQVYWEWDRRMGNPGRLVAIEPDPYVRPALRNVLVWQPLSAEALQGARRIWLVTALEARRTELEARLRALGWTPVGDFRRPELVRFARATP